MQLQLAAVVPAYALATNPFRVDNPDGYSAFLVRRGMFHGCLLKSTVPEVHLGEVEIKLSAKVESPLKFMALTVLHARGQPRREAPRSKRRGGIGS